jgi:hypothetical protein
VRAVETGDAKRAAEAPEESRHADIAAFDRALCALFKVTRGKKLRVRKK